MRASVLSGDAGIATLTELLPQSVAQLLLREPIVHAQVPTVALSLDRAPGTFGHAVQRVMRCFAGLFRGAWSALRDAPGFIAAGDRPLLVEEIEQPPEGSLLHTQLTPLHHHQDTFRLTVRGEGYARLSAQQLLAEVLEGFLVNRPPVVSWLMRVRNFLVTPMKLRTSPLGCPVSSLLSQKDGAMFAGKYPVLEACSSEDGKRSQVVLGADDRHLVFRSCVGVQIISDSQIDFTLGTRVRHNNGFGYVYMSLINRVHRRYISPAMLRSAVASSRQYETLQEMQRVLA
ncbi:MAG: DUF2867 domain-containing protein [Pseudoxanthomonas sp.]